MKNKFMVKMQRGVNKVGFFLNKKSPEILVGVGIAGVVASAVLACVASTKVSKIIEEKDEALSVIDDAKEKGEEFSEEDTKKYTLITYVQAGVKFARLYAPSALLGAASITCILMSHSVMKKRHMALAAAYAAMDKSFSEYRGRVLERFGEEVEKEIRYNLKSQEIETTETDENGKEKKKKETANVVSDDFSESDIGPYAKIFDELNDNWYKDPERNLFYLKARQSQANDMLQARGHLFLNEVYDLLGFPRTATGAVAGWVYDTKNPVGDNFVDFGLTDIKRQKVRDFINGYEPAIILDFNVCGNILDYVPTHQNL